MYERRHSSIRCFVLMACSCLWFSVAMSAQTMTFLDAQGQPATAPYLEGSRAYLRVVDPGAAGSVAAAISASRSGDYEPLLLAETGSGTGIFEGSIELSNDFPSADGLLQTGRDTSQYPWRFDDLNATYAPGMTSATAATVGSTVATFDGAGASTTGYVVGDTIFLRVTDAFANSTAGIDSAQVNLSTVVGSWGEYQTVTLTETGGDSSTFTGSVQTFPGTAPIQQDGIFEVQPGSAVWVQHDDANGQTYSAVQLSINPNQPVSLAFVDALGQPIATHQEFGWIQLRATDGALAGQWSGLMVRVTSDLRGDEEYVLVNENPYFSGIFTGSVTLQGTLLGSPVANDGILEVSEVAGSPAQRDTIRAEILDCSAAPCPTASCAMTGTTLRITDGQGADLDLIAPPATVSLEALDLSISYDLPTTATVTSGIDAETVTLAPAWQDPETPVFGRFRGEVDVEIGAAVPGDGRLQVAASDLLTAERPEALGLSSATDTAVVGSGLLAFLDRNGDPVDFVVLNGDVRVRAFYPAGNWSSTQADWITVNVTSREDTGNPRDVESLQLVETGIDTSTFVGQLPSRAGGPVNPYDGELSTSWIYGPNDTVEVVLDSITATATLRPGILRIVDVSGADLSNIAPGDPVRLHLEAPYADGNPFDPDQVWVRLLSPISGDEEGLTLLETGAQTGIFTGSLAGAIGAATQFDGVIQAQQGETVRAEYLLAYQLAVDEAVMGEGNPANTPPNAVDDAVNTADETPVTVNVLFNDSDAEGQFLTVASFTQGAGGTVTGNGGYLTYTPTAGFVGTDTFTYRLVDTQGAEDTATVTVTVEYVNDPPIVYADVATTPEDTAVTIHPLANDSDPEGQALTLDAVFPSTLGVAVITNAAAGTVVYTPNPNANGTDRFSYRVRDAGGATSLAYVDVTIQPVNDPPVAANDAVTTAEDTLVAVFPRTNDSDPDGDEIWISAPWPQASHGQVGSSATMFSYLPAANYNGTDTVTYTINDGNGRTATATVTITITPVNDPPVAVTDNVTTAEDAALTVDARANDSDPDGDTTSITAVGTAFHGTVVINGNGTLTYTPAANYDGTDWFNYTLTDGTGAAATGRVNVTLTAVNDPPDAVDDAFTLQEDAVGIWSVRSNDSDPEGSALTFVSATQGAHGLVEVFSSTIRYTPVLDYNGTDNFTYTIRDSAGLTDTATVSITITPRNDAPTAVADSATTPEDAAVAISVLANDIEPDGDTLSIFTVTQGAHGTVTFDATTATYTPQADYSGTDSFTYTMRDPSGLGGTATVTVTITPVNDPPVAANDTASTLEDTAATVNVLGNDSDLEGDALAVTGVTQAVHGAVTFNAGSVTYTPAANYFGADSFTYTIGDGNGGSATASVSVTVASANDAPSATNDQAATEEDTAVTVPVLGNDTDLDGDSLSVTGVTQGANGTVSSDAGSVTYTPAANFHGADSFTYTIGDGNGGAASATVTVTVSAVNDNPIAVADTGTVAEDSSTEVSVLDNDGDLDGDSLAVTAVTQGANGTVSFNAGSVTYTPAANFHGTDTFTYTIGDGNGGSASASVSITVTPSNDEPSAANDSGTTAEDTAVTGNPP